MANSFSRQFTCNKQSMLAVIVPELRKDGTYYEVNVKGYPRFFMCWSPLGRFDVAEGAPALPYELVLAVSDVIEQQTSRKKR
jgi:hypothetical protein